MLFIVGEMSITSFSVSLERANYISLGEELKSEDEGCCSVDQPSVHFVILSHLERSAGDRCVCSHLLGAHNNDQFHLSGST